MDGQDLSQEDKVRLTFKKQHKFPHEHSKGKAI